MINPLKKYIVKLLAALGYELRAKPKNKVGSLIQKSHLVDEQAIVQYSKLMGEVKVGPRSLIHKALLSGKIEIGSNTTVNGPGTEFYSIHYPIKIGNFCSIARGTAMQEHNHNIKLITTYFIKQRVFGDKYGADAIAKGGITIGSDVWIGTQCVILTGVEIGHGAVIAANSVVTKSIPPYAIASGSPAEVARYRFSPEIIERLLEMKWWEWSIEKIKSNKDLFYGELTLDMLNLIKIKSP